MINNDKKSLDKLYNSRKNAKEIIGYASRNISFLKADNNQESYAVSQSCEIIDNELYFNACLRVNFKTKKGKSLLESMKKTGKNPLYKLIKEVELKPEDLNEIVRMVSEQNNQD